MIKLKLEKFDRNILFILFINFLFLFISFDIYLFMTARDAIHKNIYLFSIDNTVNA